MDLAVAYAWNTIMNQYLIMTPTADKGFIFNIYGNNVNLDAVNHNGAILFYSPPFLSYSLLLTMKFWVTIQRIV